MEKYVDAIQIGARNMQNFELLKCVGKMTKPVVLKRGMSATIEEWLMAAEYVVSSGNPNVILCERGIRTFARETRNTLDITAIPLLAELCRLPVIVDISHEHIALAEATKLNINTFALVDTNSDPEGVDFIIPGSKQACPIVAAC